MKTDIMANDYQKLAMRTVNDNKDYLINGILGLCGETGEISEHIKKARYHGHELNKAELMSELGDLCWYIALLAEGLETDLGTIMNGNIEKLKKRYPEGFSVEKSIYREEYNNGK